MNQTYIVKRGDDVDVFNIEIDETAPLEKCGELNEKGKVIVRDIVAYSSSTTESKIDEEGILQIVGDGFTYILKRID